MIKACSRPKFNKAKEVWQNGGVVPIHGNAGLVQRSDKHRFAYEWMANVIQELGEHVNIV